MTHPLTNPRLALYRVRLLTHDWQYEHSDDFRVYSLGSTERRYLREMQKEVDADGKIWNEYAPKDQQIHPQIKGE